MKLITLLIFISLQFSWVCGFAEENHQDNNDCKRKKSMDEQKFCLAMAHKDGAGCESIKAFEMRMHCLHEIANFSHHSFNSYSTMKKAEESKEAK
jgi:hypothetical protein